jgi:LL-diaminopimelate aminotransferase
MTLTEKNDFLPELEIIPKSIAKRAKIIWLNYPNNPTGAVADIDFFQKAVHFAGKYNLALCHDAPYTEVAFDGFRPPSLMQIPGAIDVGIEFHSLSKTYDMTGWRIGMAVGNAKMIDALFRFKSNLDSGVPQAIQKAAIEALSGPQDAVSEHSVLYQARRDRLVRALNDIGLKARLPKASFYIWARIPDGYTSVGFTSELLDKVNVAVTPGTGYGAAGEGYVRLSLTVPDERLDEGIDRLYNWRKTGRTT